MGSNERINLEQKTLARYEHIPVKPSTFIEFRILKDTRTDNVFILKLLKVWKLWKAKEKEWLGLYTI